MFYVSTQILKIFSAIFWHTGGIVLILKGVKLLLQAAELKPNTPWLFLATCVGLAIGILKALFLFNRTCQKNLSRIDSLQNPKIWQFFRPGFFIFLLLMILGGATLSGLAKNNYPFLISVATLDFSIATALLGSSYIFWTQRALVK